MRVLRVGLVLACVAVLALPWPASAQAAKVQRIQFSAGASSATVKGSIKGYEFIDYKLRARAGQVMSVSLKTGNAGNYFNVLPPGSADSAIFIGSTSGNEFRERLASDGDYTLRVYLMRSAARRNEKASYSLTAGIAGDSTGAQVAAPTTDAKVEGTPYHAIGDIPCAVPGAVAGGFCRFGVVRHGGGTAEVTVTKPDGRTRTIFFERGRATGYERSQADRGEFKATKENDLNIILIGDERYEIPDAVVFGG